MATSSQAGKPKNMWELRFVSEYAAKFFPDDRALFNVRVGPYKNIPAGLDMRLTRNRSLGNDRPRSDLIILTAQTIVLIEAWILPSYGKVSQLMLYRQLLPSTPDLEFEVNLPIESFLLGPWENATLRNLAFQNDIGFVIYRPVWIDKALDSRAPRLREDRFE